MTLTGTAEANSTVTMFEGTSALGTATANSIGAWSYTTGQLLSGSYVFTATATDAAGNVSALSQPIDPTIMPPAVSSIVASGSGITNGNGHLNAGHVISLTVNLSEAVTVAGGTPTLTLNDGGTATYTSGSGSNALTFTYTVAAGQNTSDLAVTAVNLNSATVADAAGNTADLTAAVNTLTGTLQIDTTTPAAPVISSDLLVSGTAVTLTGTAEANSTVTVYVGTSALGTVAASGTGAWSYTTGQLSSGSYKFAATATDAAGNASTLSQSIDSTIGGITFSTNSSSQTFAASNNTVILSGSKDTVSLTGNGNIIQLSGSTDKVTIAGSSNSVTATGSGNSVSFSGTGDSIALGTGTATASFAGSGNTVHATKTTLLAADSLTGGGSDIWSSQGAAASPASVASLTSPASRW